MRGNLLFAENEESRRMAAGNPPLKRFPRSILAAFLLAGAVLLMAGPVLAQMNTAEISGVVKDPSGSVIAGAMVVGTHVATQQRFSATTNDSGLYLLPQLPLGEYTLTVSAGGFKQAVQEHVILHVGDSVRQDFRLSLGEQTETVTVEGSAGFLQTQSAEIKDVIQNQQVVDLPLKGREFLELTLLSEGVVSPPGGTRGDALQQTGKLINVMGNRTGHNLFLVDGVNVTDEYFNNVVLNPSPDGTAEFNMLKTNYNAEFGGKSGAVVNVITKSGSNAFHGSVYEFLRNDIFDARNFFARPGVATPFRENQFGATLGGPIVRDKTFFFLNYDGQRIRNSLAQRFSVPTTVERTGDLTALMSASFSQFRDPVTGTVYPGTNLNTDPNFQISPVAQALLNKVLPPTSSGNSNNLLTVGQQSIDTNQYNARIDHQFSTADSAFLRASVFDANEFDPFGSSVLNEALLPGFGRTLRTHSVNFSVGETHTFDANVLNEFRFGWLGVSGGQGDPNAGNPFASQLGLLGLTQNPADMGYPQVNLSGVFSTIGTAAGFTTRIDRNYEFFDNILWHHGKHTVQFGAYFFHLDFNPSFPNNARGTYTFNGSETALSGTPPPGGGSGNAFADFLFGVPSQGQVGIGEGAENAHTNWAHFYVQDSWQIRPSLKLDIGLRYEYNSNLVPDANQTSDIDLTAPGGPAFVISGDPSNLSAAQNGLVGIAGAQPPPIPVVTAQSVGWNGSLLRSRPLRFSPRIGIAWIIPHSGETVVRAGYGVYTNQAAYSVLQNLAENIPFFLNKTVKNTSATCVSTPCTINNILSFNPARGSIGANSVNHTFAIEYNEVWNLSLERPISRNTALELEYVGSRTVHADSSTALNLPPIGSVAPFPNLAPFTTIRWDGWASFHSLTVKASRRFTKGLSFEGSYTWSRSIDDASDAGTTNAELNLPQNIYANDLAVEKASSSFDHRNRVTANLVYDLPFASRSSGWLHRTVGGWRASGNFIAQSGAPFTVNLSAANDVAHIGLVNGNNLERPNVSGNPNSGPKTPQAWFNAAAFTLPTALSFGDTPRNDVIGPGLVDLDASLQKEASLHESLKVQFRFDVFNVLNRPNFNLPGRIFGSSTFDTITSAQDPRELQFALKLMF